MKSNFKKSSQQTNSTALGTILLLVFIGCLSIPAQGQVKVISASTSRDEMNVAGTYQRIEVRGDITVMLTNEPAGNLAIEGNSTDRNNVKATVKNGRLLINAEKKRSIKNLTLYVPVTAVSGLLITGDAQIFSSGTITTNGLAITLNGTSLVAVQYKGKLTISPADGYGLGDDMFSINKGK